MNRAMDTAQPILQSPSPLLALDPYHLDETAHAEREELFSYFKGLRDHPEWMVDFERQWQRLADYPWRRANYSKLLHHCVRASIDFHSPDHRSLMGDVIRSNFQVMEDGAKKWARLFNGKDIQDFIMSCAYFDVMPVRDILLKFDDRLVEIAARELPWELCTALDKYAALGLKPGNAALEAIEDSLTHFLHAGTCPERVSATITDFLRSYAKFAHMPKTETLAAIAQTFANPDIFFRAQHLLQITWNMATLDACTGAGKIAAFRDIASICTQNLNNVLKDQPLDTFFNPQAQHCLHDATLWFWNIPLTCTPFKEPALIAGWEGELRDIFNAVTDLRPASTHLDRLDKKTDIAFTYADGKITVHLEADGPRHFVTDVQTQIVSYCGRTRFQTALMCLVYPDHRFVRLPLEDFKKGRSALRSEIHKDLRRAIRSAFFDGPSQSSEIRYDETKGMILRPFGIA